MDENDFIKEGKHILEINDYAEKKAHFLQWRENLLAYYKQVDEGLAKELSIKTHFMENEFSMIDSCHSLDNSVVMTISLLEKNDWFVTETFSEKEALAFIQKGLEGFQRYIKAMYLEKPHKNSTLKDLIKRNFVIGNEYDVQQMVYAWLRPVFPTVRTEVNSDNGYSGMRADIYLKEYELAIEIKCTRPGMTVKKLTDELGADCFHYPVKNVYIYIYDKDHLIKNPEAFQIAFQRDQKNTGKTIRVFINQENL